jgi:hypothetical protein
MKKQTKEYKWPVVGSVEDLELQARYSDKWKYGKETSSLSINRGIDIYCFKGKDVFSVCEGVIDFIHTGANPYLKVKVDDVTANNICRNVNRIISDVHLIYSNISIPKEIVVGMEVNNDTKIGIASPDNNSKSACSVHIEIESFGLKYNPLILLGVCEER